MAILKWLVLFVFVFFAALWVARQTGFNLDDTSTMVGAAVISACIVGGFWYRYMVDRMAALVTKPEIGLGANRTATGQRITHLEREK